MADNLAWIVERESSRGRVLVFAHDLHVSRAEVVADEPLLNGHRGAGTYLAARFGRAYRVIGSYDGRAVGMPTGAESLPPDTTGIDGVLASPGLAAYLVGLHETASRHRSARGLPPRTRRGLEIRGTRSFALRPLSPTIPWCISPRLHRRIGSVVMTRRAGRIQMQGRRRYPPPNVATSPARS